MVDDVLVKDVHKFIELPANCEKALFVRGSYDYYHYGCDGMNDVGWGCGYRTLQTLCSWVHKQGIGIDQPSPVPPSIAKIQQALVDCGDKPLSFVSSREWIGSFEVFLCLDYFYGVSCKLVHISSGTDLHSHIETIRDHFCTFGGPVMMGGDSDAASKGILGITTSKDGSTFLLVLDPHYKGSIADATLLINEGWLSWRRLDTFMENSFYNLCLMQCKASETYS